MRDIHGLIRSRYPRRKLAPELFPAEGKERNTGREIDGRSVSSFCPRFAAPAFPCLKASTSRFSRAPLPSPSFLALLFFTNLRASRSMPAIAENRVASRRARPDIPNAVRMTTMSNRCLYDTSVLSAHLTLYFRHTYYFRSR
ncbi:hypothetical protein ALC62_01431 [Cyphomyrmex costatus]|uniref:Uncharacterized protein n=1 Tax=Cyphomyrmex costatus TaxID=456900 RepID=A0A195D441_9HYME|nr:hypothetical protein ALC62_01431 [Cyphomyrmex costatus]